MKLIDAKEKIKSPDAFALKSVEIKANKLLGLETLSEAYMLAILNMILTFLAIRFIVTMLMIQVSIGMMKSYIHQRQCFSLLLLCKSR